MYSPCMYTNILEMETSFILAEPQCKQCLMSCQSLQSQKTASGGLKMSSEAAGTRPIIFSIKSYPCMPKAGSHSIQGMAGHSGQTHKQIPLLY